MDIKKSDGPLIKDKPIPLRLTHRELDENEALSTQYGISKSDIGRRAYRLGLPLLKAQLDNKDGDDAQ
jgi:hypothetical protein